MTRTLADVIFAGVDVRVRAADLEPQWTRARRETYLLRQDVVRPLSIDRNVWSEIALATGDDMTTIGLNEPWTPIEASMSKAHAMLLATPSADLLVAGMLLQEDLPHVLTINGDPIALAVDPAWDFLGYDIADGMISGLSNCGYDPSDIARLAPVWGPKLNRHHLLESHDDALAFREVTDERVSEHAPFAVFALWRAPGAASAR